MSSSRRREYGRVSRYSIPFCLESMANGERPRNMENISSQAPRMMMSFSPSRGLD